jgi:hypothetical protein
MHTPLHLPLPMNRNALAIERAVGIAASAKFANTPFGSTPLWRKV